uniref:Uncharacterized protein n=1 Tax=Leersia perrieri TaxID=77586 RepID=A0A0D9WEN9_9ORYZ
MTRKLAWGGRFDQVAVRWAVPADRDVMVDQRVGADLIRDGTCRVDDEGQMVELMAKGVPGGVEVSPLLLVSSTI